MNWGQAFGLIIQNITWDLNLDPNSRFGRRIIETPPYRCNNYDYNNEIGFKVKIGRNNFIEIPISMLQNVFEDSKQNGCVYNKNVFRIHYPTRAEAATGHPCHTHVIGKIFELSGVAEPVDSGNYRIL